MLTSVDGAVVAWACWTGLPYLARVSWYERLREVTAEQLKVFLQLQASPAVLSMAARNTELPESLRDLANARLNDLGITSSQQKAFRRHFWRLLQMPRRKLLKHLSTPDGRQSRYDRLDVLGEITALRELQSVLRSERSLVRAFRAMFRVRVPFMVWFFVGVCVSVYYVRSVDAALYFEFANNAYLDASQSNEPWRLVSYTFLHGSWRHLVMNMWGIILVGYVTELILGRLLFTLVFLASALGGAVASLAYKNAADIIAPTVGASGALAGLASMALFLGLWFGARYGRIPMRYTSGTLMGGAFLVSNMVLGATGEWHAVDHACHLGGMAVGIAAGMILRPTLARRADARFGWRAQQGRV
jgi:membrane associated rhomboid family serine protease